MIDAHLIAKIVLLAFLVLYALFALLVIRQVAVMNKTLETVMTRSIHLLALAQFLASVALTILVLLFF